MMHKTRPHEAVRGAPRFVVQERERKIKTKEITKEQADEQERASQVATVAASTKDSETDAEVDIVSATLEGQRQPGPDADAAVRDPELARAEAAAQTGVDTAGVLTDSVVVV